MNNVNINIALFNTRTQTILKKSNLIYFKIGYFGISLLVLFTGFNTVQGTLTFSISSPSTGFLILLLKSSSFAISSLFSPMIIDTDLIRRFKIGYVCGISSFGFVLLAFAAYIQKTGWLIVSALICGTGGGVLWVIQGLWLTRILEGYKLDQAMVETEGIDVDYYSGVSVALVFMLYNMNGVIGNAVSYVILGRKGGDLNEMLLVMSIISLVGCLMLCFVSEPIPKQVEERVESTPKNWKLIFKVLLGEKQFLIVIPYMICQGVQLGYSVGNFPSIVAKLSLSGRLGQFKGPAQSVAFMGMIYGVGCVIGSLFTGKFLSIHQIYRCKVLMFLHLCIVVVSNSGLVISIFYDDTWDPIIPISFVSLLYGLSDYILNGIVNAMLSQISLQNEMSVETSLIFACYRFIFNLGTTIQFLITSASSHSTQNYNCQICQMIEILVPMILPLILTIPSMFFALMNRSGI